jgi:hypothetical protein
MWQKEEHEKKCNISLPGLKKTAANAFSMITKNHWAGATDQVRKRAGSDWKRDGLMEEETEWILIGLLLIAVMSFPMKKEQQQLRERQKWQVKSA